MVLINEYLAASQKANFPQGRNQTNNSKHHYDAGLEEMGSLILESKLNVLSGLGTLQAGTWW